MPWNPQHPDESTPDRRPTDADGLVARRRAELRTGEAAGHLADAVAADLTEER